MLSAILIIGNALALAQVRLGATGQLPHRGVAGLKAPAMRRSQEAWELGHRAAWPWALGGHGCAIAAAIVMLLLRAWPLPWLAALAVAAVSAITAVVGGIIAGQRAASRLDRD